MTDQVDMNNQLVEQERIAKEIIIDYAQRRSDWYDRLSLHQLLGKDIVMFAARGAKTAEDYLTEAFHAVESSSEETVMGSTWQLMIARMTDAIDSGDFTVVRDNAVWVCELKAQPNTTNSTSFPGELRGLRTRQQEIARRRRVSGQPVKAAMCIARAERDIDEYRIYSASPIDTGNRDLDGFHYRYLSGSAMWRWLAGFDNPVGLLLPLSEIAEQSEANESRERAFSRLREELTAELSSYHLGTSIDDVAKLSQRIRDERRTDGHC